MDENRVTNRTERRGEDGGEEVNKNEEKLSGFPRKRKWAQPGQRLGMAIGGAEPRGTRPIRPTMRPPDDDEMIV